MSKTRGYNIKKMCRVLLLSIALIESLSAHRTFIAAFMKLFNAVCAECMVALLYTIAILFHTNTARSLHNIDIFLDYLECVRFDKSLTSSHI